MMTTMTDDEFLRAFENASLPRDQWNHTAHVRMAWLYLTREHHSVADQIIREGIKHYNARSGNFIAYHETMTRAYIRIISHRIRTGLRCSTFEQFAAANPDLLERKSKLLLTYYSQPRLLGGTAAVAFVPPDLKPLP